MPKTRDAFALRDFEEKRILDFLYSRTRKRLGSDYYIKIKSEWKFSLPPDDIFCVGVYDSGAQIAFDEDNFKEAENAIGNLADISIDNYRFENLLNRHCRRLDKYRIKLSEKITTDETFTVEKIRPQLRRLDVLVEKYRYALENVENLHKYIMRIIADLKENYQLLRRRIFAVQLRQARKAAGFSQYTMAEEIGMTQGGYTLYENAIREPPLTTLYKICKVLNVSADRLLGLTP